MNKYIRLNARPYEELIPAWEVTDDTVSPRLWGENGPAGFAPFMAALVGIGYAYLSELLTRREKSQAVQIEAGDGDLIFDFGRDVTLDLIREAARHMQFATALCKRLVGDPLGAVPPKDAARASHVRLEINLRENPYCKVHGRLVDLGAKPRGQRLHVLAALALTPGLAVTGAELNERMAQLGYVVAGADTTLVLKVAKHRVMESLRAATEGTGIDVKAMIVSTRVNSLPALRLDLDAASVRLDRNPLRSVT